MKHTKIWRPNDCADWKTFSCVVGCSGVVHLVDVADGPLNGDMYVRMVLVRGAGVVALTQHLMAAPKLGHRFDTNVPPPVHVEVQVPAFAMH